MGDALRGQKKDVSKFTISINSDGTLTFHSDGWPDLKLTKRKMYRNLPSLSTAMAPSPFTATVGQISSCPRRIRQSFWCELLEQLLIGRLDQPTLLYVQHLVTWYGRILSCVRCFGTSNILSR